MQLLYEGYVKQPENTNNYYLYINRLYKGLTLLDITSFNFLNIETNELIKIGNPSDDLYINSSNCGIYVKDKCSLLSICEKTSSTSSSIARISLENIPLTVIDISPWAIDNVRLSRIRRNISSDPQYVIWDYNFNPRDKNIQLYRLTFDEDIILDSENNYNISLTNTFDITYTQNISNTTTVYNYIDFDIISLLLNKDKSINNCAVDDNFVPCRIFLYSEIENNILNLYVFFMTVGVDVIKNINIITKVNYAKI